MQQITEGTGMSKVSLPVYNDDLYKKLRTIATSDFPIRASLLPSLFSCSRMFVDKTLLDGQMDAGENAATGSLVHAGIQAYHQNGNSLTASRTGVQKAVSLHPSGDPVKAYGWVEKYVEREKKDPRGKVIRIEWKVKFKLPPAPIDPTKKDIIIQGTIDQVRDQSSGKNKLLAIVDHKSGMTPAQWIRWFYAPQLAGYMVGASDWYEDYNVVGYITRIQDLARSDLPYWHKMPFDIERARKMMDVVRYRIALIRMGEVHSTPGKFCEYCPHEEWPACIGGERYVSSKGRLPVVATSQGGNKLTPDDLFGKRKA